MSSGRAVANHLHLNMPRGASGAAAPLRAGATALALVLCLALGTWAGTGGSISGTVKDSSGAAIPRATVTALNTATGVRTAVTTDGGGVYSLPSLPIGHYDLEVVA